MRRRDRLSGPPPTRRRCQRRLAHGGEACELGHGGRCGAFWPARGARSTNAIGAASLRSGAGRSSSGWCMSVSGSTLRRGTRIGRNHTLRSSVIDTFRGEARDATDRGKELLLKSVRHDRDGFMSKHVTVSWNQILDLGTLERELSTFLCESIHHGTVQRNTSLVHSKLSSALHRNSHIDVFLLRASRRCSLTS